jgi:hypothetical protein
VVFLEQMDRLKKYIQMNGKYTEQAKKFLEIRLTHTIAMVTPWGNPMYN